MTFVLIVTLLAQPGCLGRPDLTIRILNESPLSYLNGTVSIEYLTSGSQLNESMSFTIPPGGSQNVMEKNLPRGPGELRVNVILTNGSTAFRAWPEWGADYVYITNHNEKLALEEARV